MEEAINDLEQRTMHLARIKLMRDESGFYCAEYLYEPGRPRHNRPHLFSYLDKPCVEPTQSEQSRA